MAKVERSALSKDFITLNAIEELRKSLEELKRRIDEIEELVHMHLYNSGVREIEGGDKDA